MAKSHKSLLYGALIVVGGIVVIVWMKNYLQDKGIIAGVPTNINADPLNLGPLHLQSWFTTALNAQPGTTAFPSQLQ